MSDDDIDLEMVVSDPHYRRQVIDSLNEDTVGRARQNADNGVGGHKIMFTGRKHYRR